MNRHIFEHIAIQKKLLFWLLFSICIPMIAFTILFRWYNRREFSQRNRDTIRSSFQTDLQNFVDQIQLIGYVERSIYANERVLTALSGDGNYESITERQAVEDYIFYMLRSIYSMTPEASLIHLAAYNLETDYYFMQNFDHYSMPLTVPENRRAAPPYSSYLVAGEYCTQSAPVLEEPAAFTVCLPMYEPPSITNSIAFLEVVIPQSRMEQMCSGLFDRQNGEALVVLSQDDEILYSSTDSVSQEVLELLAGLETKNTIAGSTLENGNTVFYGHMVSKSVDIKAARVIDSFLITERVKSFELGLMILVFSLVIMAALLMWLSLLQFTRPLQKLAAYTCAVRDGDLDARMDQYITYSARDEIGNLVNNIDDMVQTIHHYIIRQFQMDAENKDIQLKMLQAQVNPHFLYNTLQCLAGQALELNSTELYMAIASLGQMMHYAMDTEHSMVPFQKEMEYTESYLRLQRMRFPVSLQETFEIDLQAKSFTVSKMILQPLVENAVRHGQILGQENHHLWISARAEGETLVVTVRDDGCGITEEKLDELRKRMENLKLNLRSGSLQRGTALKLSSSFQEKESLSEVQKNIQSMQTHIGLDNVYQRILLRCGWECRVELGQTLPHGFFVTMVIEKADMTGGMDGRRHGHENTAGR